MEFYEPKFPNFFAFGAMAQVWRLNKPSYFKPTLSSAPKELSLSHVPEYSTLRLKALTTSYRAVNSYWRSGKPFCTYIVKLCTTRTLYKLCTYLENFICTRIRVRLICEKKFWVENWNSGGENTSFGVDFFPLADFPSLGFGFEHVTRPRFQLQVPTSNKYAHFSTRSQMMPSTIT